MGVYDYYNALSFYRQAQVQRDDHVVRMKLADCYYHRTSYQQCANLLRAVPVDTLTTKHSGNCNIRLVQPGESPCRSSME